ncbi:ppk25, partial [Symbiodinium necroappetens]
EPHLHHVKIALRNKAGDNVVPTAVPIIAPHELVPWLLSNQLLVLDDTAATKFWEHHSTVATPGVSNCRNFKDGFTVHPVCVYGDEAEYTQTKQKILVIYISYLGKTPTRDVNGQPWD